MAQFKEQKITKNAEAIAGVLFEVEELDDSVKVIRLGNSGRQGLKDPVTIKATDWDAFMLLVKDIDKVVKKL